MVVNGVIATAVKPRFAVWAASSAVKVAVAELAGCGVDLADTGVRAQQPALAGLQVFAVSADRARCDEHGLSERQLQVLHLIADGLSNSEIGVELTISINTVMRYVKAVLRKCGVSSRQEAVLVALRAGWLREDPLDLVCAAWRADVDDEKWPDLASTVLPAVAAKRAGCAA